MQPFLQPGEEILINPDAYNQQQPQINDVVIAIHPKQNLEIVKRIAQVNQDGTLFLLGDNLAYSNDSRSFGTISLAQIKGKVTTRFGFGDFNH